MNMIIVTLVALSCVVLSSGFAVGELVSCNLCHPFSGDTAPKECETNSEFGVQCPLCYQLTGPDGFLREICVPISDYMTIMNTVIQPELELCWLKNQGNCILRLMGPVSSSSPTASSLPVTTEAGTCGNCIDEESDSEASTAVAEEIVEDVAVEDNDAEDDSDQGNDVEDDDVEDDDVEDDDVEDDSIKDNAVEGEIVEEGAVEDNDAEDDSVQGNDVEDDDVEDDDVEDDSINDNAVEGEIVEEGAVEDNDAEDDSVQGNDVEYDDVEDDSIKENAVEGEIVEEGAVEDNDAEDDAETIVVPEILDEDTKGEVLPIQKLPKRTLRYLMKFMTYTVMMKTLLMRALRSEWLQGCLIVLLKPRGSGFSVKDGYL